MLAFAHSMKHHAYDYIKITMKYILVFAPTQNTPVNEYLVFNNLCDTGLENFLRTCESTQIASSASQVLNMAKMSEPVADGIKGIGKAIEKHFTCYTNEIFGLEESRCESYQDFIAANINDMAFTIINVPLSMSLFKKISNLEQDTVANFTFEEIYDIFIHLFPFRDKQGLCCLAVSLHLQNNQNLMEELKDCYIEEDKTNFDEKIRYLSACILNDEIGPENFVIMLNTSVAFRLTEDCGEVLTSHHNSTFADITQNMNFIDFSIGFILTYVYIDHNSLMIHADAVIKKLIDDDICCPLTLHIYNMCNTSSNDYNNEHSYSSEIELLVYYIIYVYDLTNAMERRIVDIILEFRGFKMKFDPSYFDCIPALSTIECVDCSHMFLVSIPCYRIKITAKYLDSSYKTIEQICICVKEAYYTDSVFINNLAFIGRHKRVDIRSSTIKDALIFSPNSNCNYINLIAVEGIVCLSGIAGFKEMWLFKKADAGRLLYEKKGPGQSLFKLENAGVYGTVSIGVDIGTVILRNIMLKSGEKIILSKANRHVEILKAYGLFDLRAYLGVEQFVNRDVSIKIIAAQEKISKLSQIELINMNFESNVVLEDVFERVSLKNIKLCDNTSLRLNTNCKELVINECQGLIDLSTVGKLDKMEMTPLFQKDVIFTFKGPVHVRHLHLTQVYQTAEEIEFSLPDFVGIEHMQISSDDAYNHVKDVKRHNEQAETFLEHENLKDSPVPLSRYSPTYEQKCERLLDHIILSNYINSHWSNLVQVSAKELDLAGIVVMRENWKSLKELVNLRSLKICVENLHADLFEYLPPSIRLLELSCVITRDKNRHSTVKHSPLGYTPLPNLRVLIVEADYLPLLRSLSTLLPSLSTIQVRITPVKIKHSLTTENKLKIRELYIYDKNERECLQYPGKIMRDKKIVTFVEMLAEHVDFNALDYLGIISDRRLIVLNPLTYEVLNKRFLHIPASP